MNHNHLSTAEVVTYRENIRSLQSINTGRHLLACKECRSKLPAATLEEFRSCILDSKLLANEESKSAGLFDFTRTTMVWSVARVTAFAGLAILLLAGVYFVGVHRSIISDDTLAKNADNSIGNRFDPIGEEPVLAPTSSGKNPSESVSPKSESNSKSKPSSIDPIADSPKNKVEKVGDTPGKVSVARKYAVSKIRGLASNCSDAGLFEMEYWSIEETHILKWKKFPNAVKYHLYISDDDEILIDEFETEQATSYAFTKPLDQKKSYRWKVIITLANGKTMNVAAQKFSAQDFLSVENRINNKSRALTRCSINQ
jgi:hypothetical protein